MSVPPVELAVPVPHPAVDEVLALWQAPPEGSERCAVLLAHGSGADMTSEFLVRMADGLSERGFGVLRFRYGYMERMAREGRRRPPDRAPVLEAVHAALFERLAELAPGRRRLLAGKSLGGRMGTHLAAKGFDAAGLVLFGYPLHPAKKPEKERREHFPAICQPGLFLQGTRDALCDLDLLRAALTTWGGRPTLHVVEGADHGFDVLVRSGRTRDEVREELLGAVDAWERATFSGQLP